MLSNKKFWEIHAEKNSVDENGRTSGNLSIYTAEELKNYDEMFDKISMEYENWLSDNNPESLKFLKNVQ